MFHFFLFFFFVFLKLQRPSDATSHFEWKNILYGVFSMRCVCVVYVWRKNTQYNCSGGVESTLVMAWLHAFCIFASYLFIIIFLYTIFLVCCSCFTAQQIIIINEFNFFAIMVHGTGIREYTGISSLCTTTTVPYTQCAMYTGFAIVVAQLYNKWMNGDIIVCIIWIVCCKWNIFHGWILIAQNNGYTQRTTKIIFWCRGAGAGCAVHFCYFNEIVYFQHRF